MKRNDTLSGIAVLYYHDAGAWKRIFAANSNKLESPDRIYVGQLLRIPLD